MYSQNGHQQEAYYAHQHYQQPPPQFHRPIASSSTTTVAAAATPRVKTEFEQPSMAGGQANAKGGASEFVKKLYKMLEESAHTNIVSWGAKGESFLVKDMNEFTKTVLPLHFKHSNFASFVRQLNKYDFHKVKASEGGEGIYGDHTWEFKHPNFRADTKKSLEFIKRKGPAPRKSGGASAASNASNTPTAQSARADSEVAQGLMALQQQFANLAANQHNMGLHMSSMSRDLHNVYAELVKFQHTFVAQDQLIQNIIQYVIRTESTSNAAPGTPSPEAQQLLNSYAKISHASAEQLAELTQRASAASGHFSPTPPQGGGGVAPVSASHSSPASSFDPASPHPSQSAPRPPSRLGIEQYGQRSAYPHPEAAHQHSPLTASPRNAPYYPQDPSQAQPPPSATQYNFPASAPPPALPPQAQQHQQQQQAAPQQNDGKATTEAVTAGSKWRHLPRVLVVEDDVVCRKLSSRFLEVFGCQIDTAVDGVEAVKKMNTLAYDLVFMDIAMPNLDGVSATSIIRQFNSSTPIISMTSNSQPDDILTYFSHGMTDVLPKPFTKEALRNMLEKHLVHLTQIKQLVEVPRALGFPESQISDALASTLAPSYLQSEAMFGQEPLNPFTEMGITDEDFTSVLLSTLTPGQGGTGVTPPIATDGMGDPAAAASKVTAGNKRGSSNHAHEPPKRARYEV